jgi:diguanylate cyclase (GGDEF)-like protein
MSTIGRIGPKATGERLEVDESARDAPLSATTLSAREAAVLAREQAADLREEAADRRDSVADRRDKVADQREELIRDADERRAHGETQLLEANEHLVVAAIHSQTMAEIAEHTALQMSWKAERDFLTGLPNRALLVDRLAQSIALAQRHGKRVAVMYLDLDNFKDINDSLGHSVGDQVLQSTAMRLEGCVRHSDTVSRHGGDEFVVLLSEVVAGQDAVRAAEKLIKAMAEPHFIGAHRLYVTLSIGISLYPDDGADAEAVLTNADTAMYHAKRNGRNSYRRFDPEMNASSVARQLQ